VPPLLSLSRDLLHGPCTTTFCGTPLRQTLPITSRIKLAIPKMSKIWFTPQLALGGHDSVKNVFEMEQLILEVLESSEFTDDAITL
jgi:hypothetical protein